MTLRQGWCLNQPSYSAWTSRKVNSMSTKCRTTRNGFLSSRTQKGSCWGRGTRRKKSQSQERRRLGAGRMTEEPCWGICSPSNRWLITFAGLKSGGSSYGLWLLEGGKLHVWTGAVCVCDKLALICPDSIPTKPIQGIALFGKSRRRPIHPADSLIEWTPRATS